MPSLRSSDLLSQFKTRRSVRRFSDQAVDLDLVRNCIAMAGTAPSGANKQPWSFVLIHNKEKQREIRLAAEQVEAHFYEEMISEEWREDLAHLKTDAQKPFIEEAPCLIAVFVKRYTINSDGEREKIYYPSESIGIALGMLFSGLTLSGLSSLPYTPAPMNFLKELLGRPEEERPVMLLPVGYPHKDWIAPDLDKKKLNEFLIEMGD